MDYYEEKYSNCIQEVSLSGTFRYEIMDESLSCLALYDDVFEPNLWEIVNSLAVEYEAERQLRWKILKVINLLYRKHMGYWAKCS